MVDYIINRIDGIFNSVINVGDGNLIISPENFNSSIYNGVQMISENAVKPIAYLILGLLLVLELYNISVRTEIAGSGQTGVEIVIRTMIKLALCKIVIDNVDVILETIYAISATVISNIGNTINGGNPLEPADLEVIKNILEDMDFGVKLLTAVEVTLIWFIVKFTMLFITVAVISRMIELYVLLAIAPIPVSTIPNIELSSVAKNFLKYFTAVCLQGVLIYIVVAMFPLLFGSAILGDINDAQNFSNSMLTAAGYSFVLLIAIFACGRWAKSICNAM